MTQQGDPIKDLWVIIQRDPKAKDVYLSEDELRNDIASDPSGAYEFLKGTQVGDIYMTFDEFVGDIGKKKEPTVSEVLDVFGVGGQKSAVQPKPDGKPQGLSTKAQQILNVSGRPQGAGWKPGKPVEPATEAEQLTTAVQNFTGALDKMQRAVAPQPELGSSAFVVDPTVGITKENNLAYEKILKKEEAAREWETKADWVKTTKGIELQRTPDVTLSPEEIKFKSDYKNAEFTRYSQVNPMNLVDKNGKSKTVGEAFLDVFPADKEAVAKSVGVEVPKYGIVPKDKAAIQNMMSYLQATDSDKYGEIMGNPNLKKVLRAAGWIKDDGEPIPQLYAQDKEQNELLQQARLMQSNALNWQYKQRLKDIESASEDIATAISAAGMQSPMGVEAEEISRLIEPYKTADGRLNPMPANVEKRFRDFVNRAEQIQGIEQSVMAKYGLTPELMEEARKAMGIVYDYNRDVFNEQDEVKVDARLFPELAAKQEQAKAAIQARENLYAMAKSGEAGIFSPFLILEEQITKPIRNRVASMVKSIGDMPKVFSDAFGYSSEYGSTDMLFDTMTEWADLAITPQTGTLPSLNKGLFEEGGAETLLPKLSAGVVDLALFMGAGTIAGPAGIIGAGFVTQAGDNYREFVEVGFNREDAARAWLALTAITSTMEILVQENKLAAGAGKAWRGSLIRELARRGSYDKNTLKEALKSSFESEVAKGFKEEALEEVYVELADGLYKSAANRIVGEERFEDPLKLANLMEAGAIGGILGGKITAFGYLRKSLSPLEAQAVTSVAGKVAKGESIPMEVQSELDKNKESVDFLRNWWDVYEAADGLPDDARSELTALEMQKRGLQESQKNLSVPNPSIKKQIEEIDAEIARLITVGELVEGRLNTRVVRNGEVGDLYVDGQTVVFDNGKTVYELGNVNELARVRSVDLGVVPEFERGVEVNGSKVSFNGQTYVNNYSDPTAAINRDKDGNIVSVSLDTEDGQKRTFRGRSADDLAYEIMMAAPKKPEKEVKAGQPRDKGRVVASEVGVKASVGKPKEATPQAAPQAARQATPQAGSVVGEEVEAKRIETEAKIKRKDLFSDGGVFANELGGSGVNSVPTNHSERNGIEFVQFSNPNTGIVDVIMTGKSDNDFVGYYRIYENGKATNKWSSKFENQSRNKEDFKTMISGVQEMLPQGHEYTEKTSISTDGLRIWNQQLNRGYELQYDDKGNLITNRVAINGDAINNELGIAVNKGNFENVSVTNNADMKKVKEALLPYLQKFGLNESNIHFENGTVEIDLPVLKSNKAVEQLLGKPKEAAPQAAPQVTTQATPQAGSVVGGEIKSNWNYEGEGDAFASNKDNRDGKSAYTIRILDRNGRGSSYNRAKQRGELDTKSPLTYEGDKESISAIDGNGNTVGVIKLQTDGGVEHIVVAPEFSRKGVASELIKQIKQKGAKVNFEKSKLISPDAAKLFNKIRSEQSLQSTPQAGSEQKSKAENEYDAELAKLNDDVTKAEAELRKEAEKRSGNLQLFEVKAKDELFEVERGGSEAIGKALEPFKNELAARQRKRDQFIANKDKFIAAVEAREKGQEKLFSQEKPKEEKPTAKPSTTQEKKEAEQAAMEFPEPREANEDNINELIDLKNKYNNIPKGRKPLAGKLLDEIRSIANEMGIDVRLAAGNNIKLWDRKTGKVIARRGIDRAEAAEINKTKKLAVAEAGEGGIMGFYAHALHYFGIARGKVSEKNSELSGEELKIAKKRGYISEGKSGNWLEIATSILQYYMGYEYDQARDLAYNQSLDRDVSDAFSEVYFLTKEEVEDKILAIYEDEIESQRKKEQDDELYEVEKQFGEGPAGLFQSFIAPPSDTENEGSEMNDSPEMTEEERDYQEYLKKIRNEDVPFRKVQGPTGRKGPIMFGKDAAKKVANFLSAAGIKVVILSDADYNKRAAKEGFENTQGVFLSNSGEVVLNESDLNNGWGDVLAFHEGIHPVINIIRNTNPRLYRKLVDGIKKEAARNKNMATAISEVMQAEKGESESRVEDEIVVEVLARVVSGDVELSKVGFGLKQAFIDFINMISKALGLGKLPYESSDAAIRRFGEKLTTAMQKGGSISDVVGKGNEKEGAFTKSLIKPLVESRGVQASRIQRGVPLSQSIEEVTNGLTRAYNRVKNEGVDPQEAYDEIFNSDAYKSLDTDTRLKVRDAIQRFSPDVEAVSEIVKPVTMYEVGLPLIDSLRSDPDFAYIYRNFPTIINKLKNKDIIKTKGNCV